MRGVILDADSLGSGVDLSPITDLLDDWQVYPSTAPDQVQDRVRLADVILTNKIPLDAALLEDHGQLRFVSVMATGTNNVDLAAAKSAGVQVSNAVAYATPSVVQHTISLILLLSTNVHRYLADVREGSWQQSDVFCLLSHPIQEVTGKQLGIIGYGELGSNVARAAKGLGMRVAVAERRGRSPRDDRIALDELLSGSDYISLHCPLNADTASMINAATLGQMKPSAFLINTARGGLVDSQALIEALSSGVIAGAAVDVLDREPPTQDEPLLDDIPNLLVTPHNAWGAIESRTRLVEQMRENILGFLAGNPPRLVNP